MASEGKGHDCEVGVVPHQVLLLLIGEPAVGKTVAQNALVARYKDVVGCDDFSIVSDIQHLNKFRGTYLPEAIQVVANKIIRKHISLSHKVHVTTCWSTNVTVPDLKLLKGIDWLRTVVVRVRTSEKATHIARVALHEERDLYAQLRDECDMVLLSDHEQGVDTFKAYAVDKLCAILKSVCGVSLE